MALVALSMWAVPISTASGAANSCAISSSHTLLHQTYGVRVDGRCAPISSVGTSTSPGQAVVRVRTVSCGVPRLGGAGTWSSACGSPRSCMQVVRGRGVPVAAMATQQWDPATGQWVVLDLWCPTATRPVPNTAALRASVLRLLPEVAIGTTSANTLVNIQTILWADTAGTRSLGAPMVLGRAVHLRVTLDSAQWDFGDGQHDTSSTAGASYPSKGSCATVQCPGYYGHTYRVTGVRTISLQVAWRAEFSLDGAHDAPIGDTALPGPRSTTQVRVKEARGVLVPNPNN